MFKLFKSAKNVVANVATVFKPTKDVNELVEEIHNEFDAAQDRLLQEAKNIINGCLLNNKAERLKNLGFSAAEIVVQNEAKKRLLVKSKEQADLIEYYATNYPFQKFLTEDELDRICKKYNLVYAPVSAYKKDVPEKNIYEIEGATPLKQQDFVADYNILHITSWWRNVPNEIKEIIKKGLRWDSSKIEEAEDRKVIELIRQNGYNGSFNGYIYHTATITTIKRQGLFIAAPKSYFNLDALKQDNQFGYFSFSEREINDPIVFRFCNGGIQIITKWGLEASDEIVVNEKMN